MMIWDPLDGQMIQRILTIIMQIMFYDQVAEEKANARESSYKEQIKTLTAKLKQESTS